MTSTPAPSEPGPLELGPGLDALRSEWPSVAIVAALDSRGAVHQPRDVERILLRVLRQACQTTPDGGQVAIATRDLADPTHWLEVVIDEPSSVDVPTRVRLLAGLLMTREGRVPGLHVSKTPGRGASTRLVLPALAPAPAQVPDHTPIVLLAEDDPDVREGVAAALREANFYVLAASDGQTALDAAPARLDLLVSDVLMPHVSGVELARRLRERQPDLKVLFMSCLPIPRGVDLPGPLVRKPLDIESFARELPGRAQALLAERA